jgi:hypothetical protein
MFSAKQKWLLRIFGETTKEFLIDNTIVHFL